MQAQHNTLVRAIGAYGVAHALVDASCAALVFSAVATGRLPSSVAVVAILAYNLLAFASQPILGWFVNDAYSARTWARAGALVTAAAYLVLAIILAGRNARKLTHPTFSK